MVRSLPLSLFGVLLICWMPTALAGATGASVDVRQSLGLTPEEQHEFLSEMRQMLASVHGIVSGIARQDREQIAAAARRSGNRMARATPPQVRARLPQAFKDIGGPTHMLFEELAVRASSDDMDTLTGFTGEILQQCINCHAMFRAQ